MYKPQGPGQLSISHDLPASEMLRVQFQTAAAKRVVILFAEGGLAFSL